MTRITHVNLGGASSAADGIGSVVESLRREQGSRGEEVLVLGPGSGADRGSIGRTCSAAVRQLSAFGPDIVHFHSVFRPVHALLAAWCRRSGLPYVVSPHSAFAAAALRRDPLRKRFWIRTVDGPMLHGASGVICLTPQERTEVLDAVPGVGTHVVPNLVPGIERPVVRTRPASTRHARRQRIVTLARYDVYQKGLDRISAVAALLPDVDFVVHGTFDGNDPAGARELIRVSPPNLAFPGIVTGAEKYRVLAEADLYLQPSRWEGMSVAVLEAMRAGVPCAVSPEVALTLGDGAETVTVVPDEPDQAAESVTRLLGDPEMRCDHARDAQRWAERMTDPDHVIAALHQAYELGETVPGRGRSNTRRSGAVSTTTVRIERSPQQ